MAGNSTPSSYAGFGGGSSTPSAPPDQTGKKLADRAKDVKRILDQVLKTAERTALRQRLGESLARLLAEHEPAEAAEETVTVFLTEQEGDGLVGEGDQKQPEMA